MLRYNYTSVIYVYNLCTFKALYTLPRIIIINMFYTVIFNKMILYKKRNEQRYAISLLPTTDFIL